MSALADIMHVHKTLRGAEVWMRVSTYVLNPLLTHTHTHSHTHIKKLVGINGKIVWSGQREETKETP